MLLPLCPIGHGLLTEFFHWLTPIVGWVPQRERGKEKEDWKIDRKKEEQGLTRGTMNRHEVVSVKHRTTSVTHFRILCIWVWEMVGWLFSRPELLSQWSLQLSWESIDNYLRGRSSCFHPALVLQCLLQHTSPVSIRAELFWNKRVSKPVVTKWLCLILEN